MGERQLRLIRCGLSYLSLMAFSIAIPKHGCKLPVGCISLGLSCISLGLKLLSRDGQSANGRDSIARAAAEEEARQREWEQEPGGPSQQAGGP